MSISKFEIRDEVIAPTVFKGVGLIVCTNNRSPLRLVVVDEQNQQYMFTADGKINLNAEAQSLFKYTDPVKEFVFSTIVENVNKLHDLIVQDESAVKRLDKLLYDFAISNKLVSIRDKDKPIVKHQFEKYDSVLVRDKDTDRWILRHFYDIISNKFLCHNTTDFNLPVSWNQCIPFKGNEHLYLSTHSPEYKIDVQEVK